VILLERDVEIRLRDGTVTPQTVAAAEPSMGELRR
jgi:hypothetical protein